MNRLNSTLDPSGKTINWNIDLKKQARIEHRETKKQNMQKRG